MEEIKCPHCYQYNYVHRTYLNPYKYRYFRLKCCHCCKETEIDNINFSWNDGGLND